MKSIVIAGTFLSIIAISAMFRFISKSRAADTGYSDLKRILAVIELLMWIVFLFWSADLLFRENSYYNYIIALIAIIIISGFVWLAGRDMAGGLFFRIRYDFKEGSIISFGQYRGKIVSAGITSLTLRSESGELLRIPYSSVVGKVVSALPEASLSTSHSISVTIGRGINSYEAISLVKTVIMSCPWVSINEDPVIETDKHDRDEMRINIRVSVIDDKFFPDLIQRFRDHSDLKVVS